MHYQKSKKILIYIFLFFLIGTLNNKNFNLINFAKIEQIYIKGLDEENSIKLLDNLNLIKGQNLFFLKDTKISEIIYSNNLVEKFSIFKNYPSTLNIDIEETIFLAKLNKDNDIFFLGTNGKLIKKNSSKQDLPFIFGDFEIENFFLLKKILKKTNIEYDEIQEFLYFPSGRWDIKFKNGKTLRLPKNKVQDALELYLILIQKKDFSNVRIIDLRQKNQVIINE